MSQDSENWSLLQSLFHLAEETPAEERERVLAEHCADAALVQRALSLLRSSLTLDSPSPAASAVSLSGRIGPYTLIRLLGSGGIGSVYLAERIVGGAPHRCALKMLAPHAAGPSFVERFHREQHILASLDHLNITRLLDAGLTDAGQPWLAMDYVEGEHLDVYCDSRKLSIPERLRLFLQVCESVAYAHRNLIVHLDLKPSNVMVTGDGVVKLLDFGTSKLIQTDSQLTTTVMATPAYASPEQLRNEGVTTACDIYSLGAVLVELLAGKHSTRRTSAAVLIERALSGQEPDRLENCVTPEAAPLRSTTEPKLHQALKGDLSVITAKCLRASPADRYRSVEMLAEDIRRHLSGRTVLATPQTFSYQLAKFLRRNRKAATVSVLAFLIILGAIGYAVMRQREALRQAQRAVQMQTLMTQLFQMANAHYLTNSATTVPDFLKLGITVLPQVIHDPADQRAAALSLAESMYYNEDYQDALPVLEHVADKAKADRDIPAEAEAEAFAGRVAYRMGRISVSMPLSSHAMEMAGNSNISPSVRVWIKTFYTQDRNELSFTDDHDIAIQKSAVREAEARGVPDEERAYAYDILAMVISQKSSPAEQEALVDQAMAIYRRNPYAACDMALTERLLAYIRHQARDYTGSLATYRESLDGILKCRGEGSNEALLASGYVGDEMVFAGQPQQAIPMLESTLQKLQKVEGPDNPLLAYHLSMLARAYLAEGRYQDAERPIRQVLTIFNGKLKPGSYPFGAVQALWAQALAGEGRTSEALVHAQLADAIYGAVVSKDPNIVAGAAKTHQLVLNLQAKLNPSASPATPRASTP